MESLHNKVLKAEPDIAYCSWKECKERGAYIRCYFDLSELCPRYITHKNYLKTISEIKERRKYIPRHHPRKR